MAIEIIPKKKEIVPPWQILIFVISIIILLASVLFYLFLSNQEKKYQTKIKEIQKIIDEEAKEKEGKIKEVSEINNRISTFSKIIQNHFFVSDLFKLISDLTHPKVYYKNFDLNTEKNSLSLSGETENFFTLGQQILLFKENEMIKGIDISKISKTKEGKVEFGINLILNPEIFKWRE
jgi:uncharacterized protein YoxC